MSDMRDEKLIRFVPVPGEAVEVRAVTWRTAPPTADEVRVCSWWWHRTRDGDAMLGPSVISLDIEDDGVIFVAESGGERFLPEDWGTEWVPCLPPEDGKLSWLAEPTNEHGSREREFPAVVTVNPPANPTTLGDVWIAETREQRARNLELSHAAGQEPRGAATMSSVNEQEVHEALDVLEYVGEQSIKAGRAHKIVSRAWVELIALRKQIASVLDGTFSVGDGTTQQEIELADARKDVLRLTGECGATELARNKAQAERGAMQNELDDLRERLTRRVAIVSEGVALVVREARRWADHPGSGMAQVDLRRAVMELHARQITGEPAKVPLDESVFEERDSLRARLAEIVGALRTENDEQGVILRAIADLQAIDVAQIDAGIDRERLADLNRINTLTTALLNREPDRFQHMGDVVIVDTVIADRDQLRARLALETGTLEQVHGRCADPNYSDRRAPVPPSLTPEQGMVLARCFRIGFGELQARVVRGDEDDHLVEMIDTFDVYFAVCRAKLGHDQVPIGTWETYTAIKHRNALVEGGSHG